jgi:NAD(P)H-flavin reductase
MTVPAPGTELIQLADPMQPLIATIAGIDPEADSVATFWLRLQDAATRAAYSFQPGQFNMLYLPGFGEVAISLSSDPGSPRLLGHTIRRTGVVTRGLERLRTGDVLGVRGPFGTSWPVAQAVGRDLLLVAGGIGLAPLRPVIFHLLARRSDYGRVALLYGARTPADLLYTHDFELWRQAGIDVHATVDRPDAAWPGAVGVVPMLLYKLRPDPVRTVVMTCGPEIMMRFVVYEALARRIPPASIYLSMERNMKCGIGLCGHCQFGPAFVCREGPVFSYASIAHFFDVQDF